MKKFPLFIPWLIVCIAVVGSLFFSQLHHLEPCTLCWYQRIIIFPLAVILGIAAFRNAYRIILYVLPLSLIGLAIAIYHVSILYLFADQNVCTSCSLKKSTAINLPFPILALIAFLLLNIALIWIYYKHKKSRKL